MEALGVEPSYPEVTFIYTTQFLGLGNKRQKPNAPIDTIHLRPAVITIWFVTTFQQDCRGTGDSGIGLSAAKMRPESPFRLPSEVT